MKKQLLLLSMAMSFASCATKQAPKNACVINYKSKVNDHLSQEIQFKGNQAEHYSLQHCAHFDFFFCTVKGELKGNDVIIDYPGLFGSKGKVATLNTKKKKITYKKSFLDKIVKTQNVKINMKDGTASFERYVGLHEKLLNKDLATNKIDIQIGKNCSYKEAALGTVLFSKTLRL